MSEGYARVKLTKGNEMDYKELVGVVKAKHDFGNEASLVFILSLIWSLSDDKLKEKVIKMVEES